MAGLLIICLRIDFASFNFISIRLHLKQLFLILNLLRLIILKVGLILVSILFMQALLDTLFNRMLLIFGIGTMICFSRAFYAFLLFNLRLFWYRSLFATFWVSLRSIIIVLQMAIIIIEHFILRFDIRLSWINLLLFHGLLFLLLLSIIMANLLRSVWFYFLINLFLRSPWLSLTNGILLWMLYFRILMFTFLTNFLLLVALRMFYNNLGFFRHHLRQSLKLFILCLELTIRIILILMDSDVVLLSSFT